MNELKSKHKLLGGRRRREVVDRLLKQILIHISGGLDSILIFRKHFLSVLKKSKTFVFFLRPSGEYSKKYIQGSFFNKDLKNGSLFISS